MIAVLVALLLAGCATAQPVLNPTPVGIGDRRICFDVKTGAMYLSLPQKECGQP